jgi:NitT/TauT family transport system permease protein
MKAQSYLKNKKIDVIGLVLPLIILIIWYFAENLQIVGSNFLPNPQNVLNSTIDFAFGTKKLSSYSGKLFENLSASALRVIKGFGISIMIGFSMGCITGRNQVFKRIFDPLIQGTRTIPGISWLPIALVWFGVGEKTTIFLIAFAAFFPIYLNTVQGVSEVPILLIKAGKTLGANKLQIFTSIIFPSAFPSILTGLRLGLGISWAYLVLGELTGVTKGLGAVMMDSRMLGNIEMVMVTMICIAVIGVISDRFLLLVCKLLFPYIEYKEAD